MKSAVVYSGPNDLIERVERDGCFVARHFFAREAVEAARSEIEQLLDRDEARRKSEKIKPVDQSTPLRSIYVPLMHTLWFVSVQSPAFCRLVNDMFASETIKSFLAQLAGDNIRIRVDLARRSSGRNDYVDDFQIPHEWHRDTKGEFTFGIFLDDLEERNSGGTACIRGTHNDACDPRWDLMLGSGVNKTRQRYLANKLLRDIPPNVSSQAKYNAQVREQSRPLIDELLGKMGDLYFFLNETWHGRAPNTTGKRFMLARIGCFATDVPFKDDIELPPQIEALPTPLKTLYGRSPTPNASDSLLRRLYAGPRYRELSQAARREKDGFVAELERQHPDLAGAQTEAAEYSGE